jgi:hypothetical protein
MNNEFTIKVNNTNYVKELVSILVNSDYPVTVKKITHEWPYDHEYHYEITITGTEVKDNEKMGSIS